MTSYAGWRGTTNEIRLITGLCAGYALGLFIVPLLNSQLWRVQDTSRPLEKPWQVVLWLATMPVVYAIVWWVFPLLGIWFPIIVGVAILVTFTLVNLVVVALFRPFENRAESMRDVWVPLLIAFGLTVFEIAGSAALKAWLVHLAESLTTRT